MRPLSHRIVNNLRNPWQIVSWWQYQNARPKDKDTYLITLTGAGTHWVRMMFARALIVSHGLPDEITSIRPDALVPEFLVKTQRFKYNDRPDIPRIQQSHIHYTRLLRNKRIILLVRDLRDAIVSHYKTYIAVNDITLDFSDFLQGKGIAKGRTHTLVTRINFLNSWHHNQGALNDLHLLRFEDLKQDTQRELRQALDFSGFTDITDAQLDDVVAFCALGNMQQIERANPLKQYANKTTKIRDGKSNGYKDYFSPEDREYFMSMVSENLIDTFGYNYSEWD